MLVKQDASLATPGTVTADAWRASGTDPGAAHWVTGHFSTGAAPRGEVLLVLSMTRPKREPRTGADCTRSTNGGDCAPGKARTHSAAACQPSKGNVRTAVPLEPGTQEGLCLRKLLLQRNEHPTNSSALWGVRDRTTHLPWPGTTSHTAQLHAPLKRPFSRFATFPGSLLFLFKELIQHNQVGLIQEF